jgi:hypothetical protein
VPHIAAPTSDPIRVVGIFAEIAVPRLAPPGVGQGVVFNDNWVNARMLLSQLFEFAPRPGPFLGNGYVARKTVVSIVLL